MKKIMFDDNYGLTQAVREGRKTMTRRIATAINHPSVKDVSEWGFDDKGKARLVITYRNYTSEIIYPTYQPGEVVAVAQSYEDVYQSFSSIPLRHEYLLRVSCLHHTDDIENIPGWKNKMFIKSNLMLDRIRFTNVKLERLQDISEEDCLKEGVFKYEEPPLYHEYDRFSPWPPYVRPYKHDIDNLKYFSEARYAFAYLIDKVNGKGTLETNPYVFAYEFELVK